MILHPFGFFFKSLFLFHATCRPGKGWCYCPWQSDYCCWDWNVMGVGWSSPNHTPPVAATRPLTQAHGLIWSQRRGQWLLPDFKEVFGEVSVRASKVGQECSLPGLPSMFYVIQRAKVGILTSNESASSVTNLENMNCRCFLILKDMDFVPLKRQRICTQLCFSSKLPIISLIQHHLFRWSFVFKWKIRGIIGVLAPTDQRKKISLHQCRYLLWSQDQCFKGSTCIIHFSACPIPPTPAHHCISISLCIHHL